jgi:hypothetical protein
VVAVGVLVVVGVGVEVEVLVVVGVVVEVGVAVVVEVEVIRVLTNERRTYEKANDMPRRGVLSDGGRLYPYWRKPLRRSRIWAIYAQ